ncbi:SRPBCC family protein [Nocardioides jiangxiensis]|uniref:SRPBCC family protein n=1 Tax=Nocardioides jiangxiensis TaxID=3064524 RepID=A0ABT9B4Q4_9ACTN|nr:SRPBCC family protein [Nocardioides sp. WY-20]MDO7869294.1 SRPBCC family protein [Nocardioides sp. WY-20]
MAEQTTSSIVVDASPGEVMAVIADFAAYPVWAKGVMAAEVVAGEPGQRAEKVHFELDVPPIRDAYTLAYTWHDLEVSWTLAEGRMLHRLDGSYVLKPVEEGTEVTYSLTAELAIPMIGMIKRKGEKILIDTALKGLKKRVESL